MKINRLIITGLIILLTSAQAGAATVSWDNVGNGLWSISGNWSPVTVPDSEDDVFINNSGTGTITVDNYVTAKTLTVGGAKKITLSTGKLTVASGDYTSHTIGTLKYVPPGSFLRDGNNSNLNISTVTKAFRMSEYEIIRSQFWAIMGADPSSETDSTGWSDPVQNVNWYHAIAFCNKLSIAEGFTRVYDVAGFTTDQDWVDLAFGSIPTSDNATWKAVTANWSANGYRLPTEMEWMWAAMGATSGSGWTSPTYLTGYGKPFAGSNTTNAAGDNGTNVIGDYAWTWENSSVYNKSHPVGNTGIMGNANELGFYDMSGNVWEWCWDLYREYPDGTLDNDTYRGGTSGTDRVRRGGSWYYDASLATVACRVFHDYPSYNFFDIGFRVVRP